MGIIGISFDPDEESLAQGRLSLAAVISALLAKDVWSAAGLDPSVLTRSTFNSDPGVSSVLRFTPKLAKRHQPRPET